MNTLTTNTTMYRERLATLLLQLSPIDPSDGDEVLLTFCLIEAMTKREMAKDGPDLALAKKITQLIADTDANDNEMMTAFFESLARYTPFVQVVASYNGYVPLI